MKTKILRLALLVVAMAFAGPSEADAKPIHSSGRFGVGLGSGTLTNGLSLKYFLANAFAVQANVGRAGGGHAGDRFKDNGGIAGSLDLLIENKPLIASKLVNLEWSYGLGGGVASRNDTTALAAAAIAGLELNFNVIPIDLVLEFRPTLLISPEVEFEIVDFSGHLRFYFQ